MVRLSFPYGRSSLVGFCRRAGWASLALAWRDRLACIVHRLDRIIDARALQTIDDDPIAELDLLAFARGADHPHAVFE